MAEPAKRRTLRRGQWTKPYDFCPLSGVFIGSPILRCGVLAATLVTALAATRLVAAEPTLLTPEQIADGWISLFDGETLFGWQPTSDADWKVEDGEIRVS